LEIAMRLMKLVVSAAAVLAMASTAPPAHAEVRIGLAAPLTGPMAWAGGISEQAAEFAVADLNASGGVLDEQIELITADDYCDGDQAVAAANKLIADRVVAVFGHECSAAAIPASKIYADAGILLFAPFATNPKLTEQGLTNVFRMVGRDDVSGKLAAELLAKRWGDKPIAIVHDGELSRPAEEVKKRLNARGITERMFDAIVPGKADYWDVVRRMRAKGIKVLYYSGYTHEAGLLIRQAREHGYELQLLASDAIGNEDFGLIAGPAAEGTLITIFPFPSGPEAAAFAAKFTDAHQPPFAAYAAFEVWAQAVEMAGKFETAAVIEALRTHEFDTVLGRVGFDAKGDVTGYATFVWHVWKDGKWVPAEPGKLTK
jgi:branched-chain amino acid transport system substrate-binding protein